MIRITRMRRLVERMSLTYFEASGILLILRPMMMEIPRVYHVRHLSSEMNVPRGRAAKGRKIICNGS